MIWFYIMMFTSPIFFWLWYEWTYRWEIFDGCKDGFWRRLRTDVWISLPGRRGKIARIARVRVWVREYARMENRDSQISNIVVSGINERFRDILRDKRYTEYEHVFLRPRWLLWTMMLASLVWPVVLVVAAVLFLIQLILTFANPRYY